jgi:hypothetical protein
MQHFTRKAVHVAILMVHRANHSPCNAMNLLASVGSLPQSVAFIGEIHSAEFYTVVLYMLGLASADEACLATVAHPKCMTDCPSEDFTRI